MKLFKIVLLSSFLLMVVFVDVKAATYYSRQTGAWNQTTTWSTASCGGAAAASLPGASDVVFICNAHVVSVTANSNVSSVTVQNGGTLTTGTAGGGANRTLTISGNFILLSGGTYIHNNNQIAATTIFAGTESFALGSMFRVEKWSSTAASLVTNCSSNFGDLFLNWNPGGFYWNNNGLGYTRTILGTFTVTNACATYLDDTNGNKTFTIGGNLVVNNGYLRFKQSGTGDVIINIGAAVQISNSSFVYGLYQNNGTLNFNAASVDLSSGNVYGIYNGDGNPTYTISGNFKQTGGDFRGIQNNATYTAGVPTFQLGSVNYSGGVFIGNYSCNTVSSTILFTVTNNLNITFTAITDLFAIHRLATLGTTAATAKLNMLVGGDMNISGTTGEFNSNTATGTEQIAISGALNISGGNNYFNVIPDYGGNGHAVTFTLNGNLNVSGGTSYLSAEAGLLTANLLGITTLSAGTFNFKGRPGAATVNLTNSYTQTGGQLNLYNNLLVASSDAIACTMNGNFTQSNGIINFSTSSASTGLNTLNLKGSTYTLGSLGNMTRAGAGTVGTFGVLNFNRAGTINMSRSGTHDIQQVKQNVLAACTLDVVSGNLQVASHATAATDYLTVNSAAVLNLNANQIFSNASAANSGITLQNNARLRTSHASGFYNNTNVAALNNLGLMNFQLDQNSIVEYYGISNQALTGINLGLATTTNHKYGILEINNTGVGTFVTPTNLPTAINAVYVRQELRLSNGIINLAGAAGNPINGGRTVFVERADPTAITRTNGFLRSEAQDHSGALNWNVSSVSGTYTVPFAFNASQYIPVIYILNSGNAGDIDFATYHTAANNLPWPPAIGNLNSEIGLTPDNRDATVDRFWRVNASGSAAADIEFNYLLSELPIAPYNNASQIRAQNYNFGVNKWQPALPAQSTGTYRVNVAGITSQSDWALANNISPLPVEWLYFNAHSEKNNVRLNWATAVEINNDYFLIERSKNMSELEVIGKVAGAGSTSQPQLYQAVDANPYDGVSYYRLRQVDFNGAEEATNWIMVNRKSKEKSQVNIWPNPFTDVITLGAWEDYSTLQIVDMNGKLIVQSSLRNSNGVIDLKNLSKGMYMANFIKEDGIVTSLKFVKQ